LPEAHRRILAAAAWKSGSARGARLMQELAASTDNKQLQAEIQQLLVNGSEPVGNTPVLSASSMNLQWGAFLASGEERHIVNVLAALGSGEQGLRMAM
jgi:hypothetical protein